MTKYREIIRLSGLGLSQTNIALSCNASKTTVNKVLKAAREQNLTWPLDPKLTDPVLCGLLFPNQKAKVTTSKRMPDYAHIRKELLCNFYISVNCAIISFIHRKMNSDAFDLIMSCHIMNRFYKKKAQTSFISFMSDCICCRNKLQFTVFLNCFS